tara:strand:+ start:3099 stop:3833 length:735 start_codon:yes stop_codon:yes gene_type:complete
MIICEIGVNHLGNLEYSKYYIESLSNSKCDAITYQIREYDFYKKEKYKNYNLSFDHYLEMKKLSTKKIGFALSNQDLLDECESLKPDFYKILSWELSNYKFIDQILDKSNKKIHISTGTSSMKDLDNFYKRYGENKRINFIHTQLSKEPKDTNLKAIPFLINRYPYDIDYGNHCNKKSVILASVTYEPKNIWIYVKGSSFKYRFHPDEFWAIELSNIDSLIDEIKIVQLSMGDGLKKSTNSKGY